MNKMSYWMSFLLDIINTITSPLLRSNIEQVFQMHEPNQSQQVSVLLSENYDRNLSKSCCIVNVISYLSVQKCSISYQLTLLMSKFCGLRSRCSIFLLWQYDSPLSNWNLECMKQIFLHTKKDLKSFVLNFWHNF